MGWVVFTSKRTKPPMVDDLLTSEMTERARRVSSRYFLVAAAAAMSAALIVPSLASAQGRVSLVKDIHPGGEGCTFVCPGSAPRNLTSFRGKLFFSAADGVHGDELWKSDGTRGRDKAGQGHTPGGG